MWIVRLALSRPYTFIVLALLLLILGTLSILRTPKDIFPNINIPVVSVVWNYTGLIPTEMAGRLTSPFERALPTTVNDIEHIESQSLLGVSVTKIFFHPSVNIGIALSQVTAIAQTLLRSMPPGALPPLVLSYNASTVPVLQMVLSSPTLLEQELFDLGNSFIRTQLASVEGAAIPYPYGGKFRQVQVDLEPLALQTYGVSPQEVNQALDAQSVIIPAGTEKIGLYEYYVKLNASPVEIKELNDLPVKKLTDSVLYIRDVAHVRDGFSPQTNIVEVNGTRAVLMPIQKTGKSSTLDIIDKVKSLIPQIKASMPRALRLNIIGDQSIFVKAAISGVIRESIIAALLTGLMIYLFVGSFRSTLIIAISIPLSILASIILFSSLGDTINIMTLGGLALAVGILVDDATVTIENINWHLEKGKTVKQAIIDGAQQIALPAFVSTICICIVFVPVFFFHGVPYFLFTPLAKAVIFGMMASYLLSRTLVPTLASYWLASSSQGELPSNGAGERFQLKFERGFKACRDYYHNQLQLVLDHKEVFVIAFLMVMLGSLFLIFPWLGTDFFPKVDSGQIKLHVQGPAGLRIEETAKLCNKIDATIRGIIPPTVLDSIVDNIGLPVSGINLSYSNSAPIGSSSADIYISLKTYHHTAKYEQLLRKQLIANFPSVNFSFLPADMVGQILNFGLPAPIDLQIVGLNAKQNRQFARQLLTQVKQVPGVVDAHIHQLFNYPQLNINVNRSFSKELGFTELDVASNVLLSLSGSMQTNPNFWLNTNNGVSYPIVVQTPQYKMDSLQTLRNIPITTLNRSSQIVGALSKTERTISPAVESHYNVQPVIDIFASVQGRDLGGVSKDIKKIITANRENLPKGSRILEHGQMKTQQDSFAGLYGGLVFAVLLAYLLIVVNFQSWIVPLVIIMALPAGLSGIAWILFLTHTTLSIPALMGAIMTMGVATANSILLVSFARSEMAEGKSAQVAMLSAGFTRLRPIIMTALAMIIGMLPMALSIGEGAEQNAPLGRAVIGGLSLSTMATLFFVPAFFCWIYEQRTNSHPVRKTQ